MKKIAYFKLLIKYRVSNVIFLFLIFSLFLIEESSLELFNLFFDLILNVSFAFKTRLSYCCRIVMENMIAQTNWELDFYGSIVAWILASLFECWCHVHSLLAWRTFETWWTSPKCCHYRALPIEFQRRIAIFLEYRLES